MLLTDSPVFAVGLMIAGLAAGMVFYFFRLKKEGLPGITVLWTALLGVLLGLIASKAGYLVHDLGSNLFDGYFDEMLSLDPTTLSFVCGCAGMTAGAALAARIGGIRTGKALDLFAAPGCVMICLARVAEGWMDYIGLGNPVEAGWLKFFPLSRTNAWGDAYLNVFVLETLTALVCLVPALRRQTADRRDGAVFERTAVCLLGAQICWEMLLQYPYIRAFVTSFVSLEQVWCAVLLLWIMIRGCIRGKRWWPLPAAAALLGISAFFQFFRDNKISFVFEEGWEKILEHSGTIAIAAFVLVSAGLVFCGLKAVSPAKEKNS